MAEFKGFASGNYNPDVLSCLANLSNDEVFTPPALANDVLDLLPAEIWRDSSATFLDPCTKTGIFLREITKRLIAGLEDEIPDLQQRINHILTKQVYGLAITELTALLARRSLYCSKFADGQFSIATKFKAPAGNVKFDHIAHTWVGGRCQYCGASQSEYDRSAELETHAYQFIHDYEPARIFRMQFDVIVGNPPYQLSDGGFGASAKPIYHHFISQAKKLNPRYLSMIVPSRWFAGGKGLDEFREEMLGDSRLRAIVDFPNASDCFAGIELKGGVCYFMWDRDNPGDCSVTTIYSNGPGATVSRPLLESGSDTFIRYNEAVSIYKKVRLGSRNYLSERVSSSKPFGFRTFVKASNTKTDDNQIMLYQNGGVGYIARDEVTQNANWIDKYKVLISAAYNAGDTYPHQIIGKPILGKPASCCTETYMVVGVFDTEAEASNFITYICTRLFRFLVMLRKPSQHATAKVYTFVPLQDFSKPWTDEELYAKYELTEDEIAFIESMIRPMDLNTADEDDG